MVETGKIWQAANLERDFFRQAAQSEISGGISEAKGMASHSFLCNQPGEKRHQGKHVHDRCSHVAVKSVVINGLVILSELSHSAAINHRRISARRRAAIFWKELRLTSILSVRNLNASPRDIFGISELPRSLTATSIMIIIAVITTTACAQLLYLEGEERLPKQQCVERMSPGRQPTLGAAPIISPF